MNSETKTLVAFGGTVVCGLGILWFAYRHFYGQKKLGKRATVKSLYIYPVKSCGGIKLDKVEIEKLGPLLDRSWVLTNSKGVLQCLRKIPKLILVKPTFEGTKYLCLDAPGMPTLKLNLDIDESKAEKKMLYMFSIHGEGFDCGDEAGKWFDEFLGKPGHRLFDGRSESLHHRELKEFKDWADLCQDNDKMIFPDSAPVMMVSESSLQAVNKALENPVDIRTFRPNIFIEGCLPFEEDSWKSVKIGNVVVLRKLRHCSRCVLTTVDMDAGIKRENQEPFKTLKRIRVSKGQDPRYNQSPLFGNHFVADTTGTINVGDEVTVLA